jgi:alkylated DNA nucleotide flippase Atl1
MVGPTDPEAFFRLVRRIPPGFVTTYGDLTPGAPRLAGRLLGQVPAGVPWWRVVRADGTLAMGSEQRERLMEEDVPFRGQRVVMSESHLPHDALLQLDDPGTD